MWLPVYPWLFRMDCWSHVVSRTSPLEAMGFLPMAQNLVDPLWMGPSWSSSLSSIYPRTWHKELCIKYFAWTIRLTDNFMDLKTRLSRWSKRCGVEKKNAHKNILDFSMDSYSKPSTLSGHVTVHLVVQYNCKPKCAMFHMCFMLAQKQQRVLVNQWAI